MNTASVLRRDEFACAAFVKPTCESVSGRRWGVLLWVEAEKGRRSTSTSKRLDAVVSYNISHETFALTAGL